MPLVPDEDVHISSQNMSPRGGLRDRLVETYAEHYRRVNESIDPGQLSPERIRHMEVMYGELIRSLPISARVLDLGCGTGMLLSWLGRRKDIVPVGVDGSSSQVELAKRYLPTVEIYCQDGLEFLRSHPQEFAGIFCTDVLEHIPGKDLLLAWVEAAAAALKPGGFFYCRSPNGANIISGYCRYRDLTHECSFTSTSMLQLLEAAGLRDCRILPIRGIDFSSRLRLSLERWFHRVVFRLCGEALEKVFTTNVCAVGYRREGQPQAG
jgi:2-polyprenyl-3-methyl-5-hydroxy-6-metoxy-1,4-benzoquinol methylase